MNKIENLRDLLIEEGRELYYANQQELKELKNIEKQASTTDLKNLIRRQVKQTESQQQNLREALDRLRAKYEGGKCEVTQTILNRAQKMIDKSKVQETRDAGIISSLQLLNHRKIAGLGSSASHARDIGEEETAKILHDALEHEKEIDKELITLAKREVNSKAVNVA